MKETALSSSYCTRVATSNGGNCSAIPGQLHKNNNFHFVTVPPEPTPLTGFVTTAIPGKKRFLHVHEKNGGRLVAVAILII